MNVILGWEKNDIADGERMTLQVGNEWQCRLELLILHVWNGEAVLGMVVIDIKENRNDIYAMNAVW